MTVRDIIAQKLTAALQPKLLEIKDNSAKHADPSGHHPGYRAGGETHFALMIVSDAFQGLSRIERHQWIYKILAEEMNHPIHALELALKAPQEHNQ